jgi:hypothetical protein
MSEQPDSVDAAIGADPAADVSGDATDNESYHGYSVDDETQPQDTQDSLVDDRDLPEPLDEGYSPPEKWSAGQKWGNTPLEEEMGETLDMRLEQEVPEPDPYAQAEAEANVDEHADDDIIGSGVGEEVGEDRAGRLVEPDEGMHTDVEAEAVAEDVGIDGAGAGAEEAAVHVIDEDDLR